MASQPGLAPQSLRMPAPDEDPSLDELIIDAIEEPDDEDRNENGDLIKIEHGDGSVTIDITGAPLEKASANDNLGWFANLVDKIDQDELTRISEDLLRGIQDDMLSRQEWIEERARGIKLLGLKSEQPGTQGSADGAPVEGMSTVRHPLLLEAVLRFQANANGEMLPTDGPVKIRNDDNDATLQDDQLANALQRDLNHYLTSTASEYYPDTDRMFLMLGFGGTSFKKIYFCPLRNRPVSESVDAEDLIVSNDATDLANAKRITHRLMMRPSTVKRMQILEVYRDVELGTPLPQKLDAVQREKSDQQGVTPETTNPLDRDREIFECYCELDIKGFEHKHGGKPSALEIPYRVTIDVSSRQILSIVRNYDEETKELPVARANFVKFTFVPGFGFYDIGLLNILGNTTSALTAAWREFLDAGMYANFPGFLYADTGGRQNTNIFRVPPGGGAQIKTGGMPINQAVMPLPYKEPGAASMQLVDNMAQTGMRIGGTSELQVGEGRADAPVGTTLAMIEQAVKILNAVHKRMHASQAEEFRLMCKCFEEHPDSFWQRNFKQTIQWDRDRFLTALKDYDLVPQADPNTASYTQRVMKIMALKQLQAANPSLYDPIAIDTAALQTIGWSNPQQFLAPPQAQASPPPELQKVMAEVQNDTKEADARMMDAQTKRMEVEAKVQQGGYAPKPGLGSAALDPNAGQAQMMSAQADLMNAETKRADTQIRAQTLHTNNENRDRDRDSKEHIALVGLAKDIMRMPDQEGRIAPLIDPIIKDLQDGEG